MGSEYAVSTRMFKTLSVLLICGIAFSACDSEDEFVCPTSGIDARLVGDWIEVDDEGNMAAKGIRIEADGSCRALGVDWSTGLPGIAEERCFFPTNLPCMGKNRILWTGGLSGPDTLIYVVTENTLNFYKLDGWTNTASYIRITGDQQIQQPVVSEISWVCDSTNSIHGPYTTSQMPYWHTYPCSIFAPPGYNNITISGYAAGRYRFSCFIPDFHGTGTYDLGSSYDREPNAGIGSLCSDVGAYVWSKDDGRSTITITTYDTVNQRVSGYFDMLLSDMDDLYMHITGSFDGPIDNH
ncbi:hypothetical protein KQI65_09375 [bacterium]|nr:hypothetical protein [bacterium]